MSRAIQCILISINYSYVYLTKVTKDSKIQKLYARYEKPLKKHPLDVVKKCVEAYFSSNAAARDPGEREFYI